MYRVTSAAAHVQCSHYFLDITGELGCKAYLALDLYLLVQKVDYRRRCPD